MPKRFLSARWLVLTTLLLTPVVTVPAMADDRSDCEQTDNHALQIQGCTNLIQSGQAVGESLAGAHYNRANAHGFAGDFNSAIADYSLAIEIKPDFALAYGNRAIAFRVKGDPDRAKHDCDIATWLNPDINC